MRRSIVLLPLMLGATVYSQVQGPTTKPPAATAVRPAPSDDKDLIDRLALDPTLKIFTRLVARAGLIEKLKSDGPFTVFAVNDAAFAKVPPPAMDALLKDRTMVKKFVSAHIVAGRFLVKDFKEGSLKSLSGDAITIKFKGGLTVNGQKIGVPDMAASNGVIQVVAGPLVAVVQPGAKAAGPPGN